MKGGCLGHSGSSTVGNQPLDGIPLQWLETIYNTAAGPWRKQGAGMATIMLVGYERNWKFEITSTTFVMVLASITCCLCFGASGSVFPIKIQILHRGSIPPVMSTEKELSRT